MERQEFHDEIEKVAYELYIKSGREEGRDVLNWLMAERMVKARRAAETAERVEEQTDRGRSRGPVEIRSHDSNS